MTVPPGWLIAGPTGSGKSALAMRLARETGGEIVNADSMQVYGDLRVLTARPSPGEEAAAPHHLFGVADAGDAWSVGRWLDEAVTAIAAIARRGRTPIVVGGTGLYFRALTQGLADIPPVRAGARAEALNLLEALGEVAFRDRLAAADAAAEQRIAPGDRQRLTRAMEVFLSGGQSLSDLHAATRPRLDTAAWRRVVLDPERATLFAGLDVRLETMLAGGAVDEVRRLMARGLPADAPVLKALGVQPIARHLRGEYSIETALAEAQRDTRRYAKRQVTWFRHQAADWPRATG